MRNKVILTGRITATPELRQNVNSDYVCSFNLAVRRKKSKNAPEPPTDFIRCEAWGNNALFLARHIKKGTLLDIEGSIRVRRYVDKKDIPHIEQLVRVESIDFAPTNNHISPNSVFESVEENPQEYENTTRFPYSAPVNPPPANPADGQDSSDPPTT